MSKEKENIRNIAQNLTLVNRSGFEQKAMVFLLTLSILLFSACGQQPEEAKLEKITIAFQEWVGYGLFYLGREKGFFREEGIQLIFIDEKLDSARRDAFKAGILDCEAGTIDLLISKRAHDTPIVGVLELDHSTGSDAIVATKDIQRLEDLIGKRVALARDDVGETFISYLFFKKKLLLNDVIIVPARSEKAWEVFYKGKADAVVTWQPHLAKALKRPGAHILISSKEEPDIIIDTLNVREDFLNEKPGLIKGLIRGWFRALGVYRKHPIPASKIIAKYYNISAEEYREAVTGLRWDDYKHQADKDETQEWVDNFNIISEIKFKAGRIPKKPNPQKSINRKLIDTLYEDSQ